MLFFHLTFFINLLVLSDQAASRISSSSSRIQAQQTFQTQAQVLDSTLSMQITSSESTLERRYAPARINTHPAHQTQARHIRDLIMLHVFRS